MLIGTLNNLNQQVTCKNHAPVTDSKNYKVDLICELEAVDFFCKLPQTAY